MVEFGMERMVADTAFHEDALRASISSLEDVVSLLDQLGLMVPAVHAATALDAVRAALEEVQAASDDRACIDETPARPGFARASRMS